jgi:hypothetical protein
MLFCPSLILGSNGPAVIQNASAGLGPGDEHERNLPYQWHNLESMATAQI